MFRFLILTEYFNIGTGNDEKAGLTAQQFILHGCPLRIPAVTPTIVTKFFSKFSQSLRENGSILRD
jgi:hypothetical protein